MHNENNQQSTINNQQDRIDREKEWHNQNYGSEVRDAAGKFYSISGIISAIRDKLIHENINANSTTMLDYGCGNGSGIISLAGSIKNGIGIDISEANIEVAAYSAKTEDIKNLDFFVMDAMHTSFKDNTFDIITGNAILHHLNLEKSLTEIRRILKHDGRAYFIEPLATNPLIELYRRLTPQMRTIDEQPFRRSEIKLIKRVFPKAEIQFCSCFTLLAIPFRNSSNFNKIVHLLRSLDIVFLSNHSPFRYLAWTCLIVLKN